MIRKSWRSNNNCYPIWCRVVLKDREINREEIRGEVSWLKLSVGLLWEGFVSNENGWVWGQIIIKRWARERENKK